MRYRQTRRRLGYALVPLLALSAQVAEASRFELLADDRFVVHRHDFGSSPFVPEEPFEAWDVGGNDTWQTSHFFARRDGIDSFQETAMWSADGFYGSYSGGDNVFDFDFSVTARLPVSLYLHLEYYGRSGFMEFERTLYRDGVPILGDAGRFEPTAMPSSGPSGYEEFIEFDDVLDPGIYRLVVAFYGLGDPGAEGDGAQAYSSLRMTVPEPVTAMLLGSGIVALGLRGRAARRRARASRS